MEPSIPLRQLGKSGLAVTPIGLGCWQFSQQTNFMAKFWPRLDDELINRIVKAGLNGGINWFDTAEAYGMGASERALSRALVANGKNPGEINVATKWWPLLRTASSLVNTIDKRLEALAPFPIDLYQVHQPWGFSSEKEEMEAMAKLVKAHKIRFVGVSNFSAARMRSAWETLRRHDIDLVSNQVRFNLLDRKIESNGILATAKELGITIIAYSPLAQGLATGKFHENPSLLNNIGMRKYTPQFRQNNIEKSRPVVETVRDLALKYGVTPSQVALNWVINYHGETVVAIPGATKETHAAENTGAMGFRLSQEDMALLEQKSSPFKF